MKYLTPEGNFYISKPMIILILKIVLSVLGIGLGVSVVTRDWMFFPIWIAGIALIFVTYIGMILLETRPIKTLVLKTRKFAEEIRCKWNKWQNLKLKKLLIVLSVIILVGITIGAIPVLAILFPNYFNACKELMSENKEVVSQLNMLDPNSAEWNSLYTQTENENPQLIECIYPSDSNN